MFILFTFSIYYILILYSLPWDSARKYWSGCISANQNAPWRTFVPVNRASSVNLRSYGKFSSLADLAGILKHLGVIILYEKPFRVAMGNESARLGKIYCSLRSAPVEGSDCSHLLVFFVCGIRRHKEECLENVPCILQGNGFKIRLKSEQKKAIRQLYKGKDLLAVHFEIWTLVTAGAPLPQPAPLRCLRRLGEIPPWAMNGT